MKTLEQQISELNREQLIEAAHFFNRAIAGDIKSGPDEETVLQDFSANPIKYLPELEELSKVILLSAVAIPEYENEIRKALAGTGKKQAILGGPEILVLAAFGLIALHIIITKGKTEETEKSTTISKDGKKIVTSKHTKYEISSMLSKILQTYFGKKS